MFFIQPSDYNEDVYIMFILNKIFAIIRLKLVDFSPDYVSLNTVKIIKMIRFYFFLK